MGPNCSNGGTTYIIGEIIAKDNLNIAYLFQTFVIFFYKATQQDSEILYSSDPWECVIKICSNGGANNIVGKIISKDNLNIAKLMQTFKNLLLQNNSTKFLDMDTNSPWVCVIKCCSSGGATNIIG